MTHSSDETRVRRTKPPNNWWAPPWTVGSDQDPDGGWGKARSESQPGGEPWSPETAPGDAEADVNLAPLEAPFGQVRSRERVRDLAEVFTHQREVDAMLDMMPDAFAGLDVKFLETSAGSGNFLTEVLRRKLCLVVKADCVSQEHYEHRLLRAASSIYGIDISPENIVEARTRMAHVLLEHYQRDANSVEPTAGFLSAAVLILGDNIVCGDALSAAEKIQLCDWRPRAAARFQRVWSYALVPPADRGLFWAERVQDAVPVHYSKLGGDSKLTKAARHKAKVGR